MTTHQLAIGERLDRLADAFQSIAGDIRALRDLVCVSTGTDTVLQGYKAIGECLGIGAEAARYRANSEGMPVTKSGRRVWIRRSTLHAWLIEQEANAKRAG